MFSEKRKKSLAANVGHVKVVKILINRGANIEAQSGEGIHAAFAGNDKVVEILINHSNQSSSSMQPHNPVTSKSSPLLRLSWSCWSGLRTIVKVATCWLVVGD